MKESTLNLGWMSVVEHRKLGTESVGCAMFRIESWELNLPPPGSLGLEHEKLGINVQLLPPLQKQNCHSRFSYEELNIIFFA